MGHVLTWDTLDGGPASILITPQQAAPWLDWVVSDPSHSAPAKGAGLKVALYTDPNRVAPGDPMYTNDEATFAHDCSNNRITVQGSPDLLMDVHSSHLWSLWPQEVQLFQSWGAVYDFIFEDSADEIQTQKLSSQPCNFNQEDWTNQTNDMDSNLGMPIIYNGLGLIPAGYASPGPSIGLNATAGGGMSEDCYSGRTPTGFFYQPHWYGTEDTEIQMHEDGKLFICQANWYGVASESVPQRMYFYASFLLTYDVNSQMVNTNFQTPSELHVMPEAQLVPMDPDIATPSDVSGLMLSTGVYGREYQECFLAHKYVGPCAAVVNPNNPQSGQPLNFPWSGKYKHTLVVSGQGVYDGGTVSVSGPAPPAQMAGGTGLIVFP